MGTLKSRSNLSYLWRFCRDFKIAPSSAPTSSLTYSQIFSLPSWALLFKMFLMCHTGSPVWPHFFESSRSLGKHNSLGAGWPWRKNSDQHSLLFLKHCLHTKLLTTMLNVCMYDTAPLDHPSLVPRHYSPRVSPIFIHTKLCQFIRNW